MQDEDRNANDWDCSTVNRHQRADYRIRTCIGLRDLDLRRRKRNIQGPGLMIEIGDRAPGGSISIMKEEDCKPSRSTDFGDRRAW